MSSCEYKGPRDYRKQKEQHSRHVTSRASRMRTAPESVGSGRNVVRMRKSNGVNYISVKINGVDMEVIFDTGASDVVISTVEAAFLYKQGKLTSDDILGETYFQVADGSIGAGTVINLRTLQIGNKVVHDVRATVVDNMEAPLLLGQSALSRFGSIKIDNERKTVEFL